MISASASSPVLPPSGAFPAVSRLPRHPSAVYDENFPCHIITGLRCQKDGGSSQVLGVAPALRGNTLQYLARIQLQGYALDDEETLTGACGIGAPFFDAHNRVAGSISVSGPTVRLDKTRLRTIAATIREGASQISRCLGYAVDGLADRQTGLSLASPQ